MDPEELKAAIIDTLDKIQEVKAQIEELLEVKHELQYLQLWQVDQLKKIG